MPPIPPMPPPPGIGGADSFFGSSATIASVVMRSPATDAAPCNATRTTFVGSMMPLDTMLPYSPFCASYPYAYVSFSRILPTTIEPSSPAFSAIWRAGHESAFLTMSIPCLWSSLWPLSLSRTFVARRSATPPPGRMLCAPS